MNKRMAILLSQTVQNPQMPQVYSPEVLARIREFADLEDTVYTPETLDCPRARQAEYVFSTWGMPALTEEQISRLLPSLKAVFYGAGSVQAFARPFLKQGVQVYSGWAANAVPVVEFTTAQILLANKGYYQSVRIMKAQGYDAAKSGSWCVMPGNFKTRVGIIGCGMIGTMVCQHLSRYRLEILAYDPFASDEKLRALGVRRASLEEIFATCHTVSNHTANNPQTVGMLHYGLFSRMPHCAAFINTGRGAQVVEEDLIRALREDPTRTAVLDVTWPEPPLADSPLWTLPNVFLSPHIAGSLGNEIERMGEYMADELQRREQGEACLYSVTEKMLETMA